MLIQSIGVNYTPRKQNNPKFGATFVQAKHSVFQNVADDIAKTASGVDISSPIMKVKAAYEQILRSLVKSNNNPNSHLVYDASCEIPISDISIETNEKIWASSSRKEKDFFVNRWEARINANKSNTSINVRTANGVYVKVAIPKDGEQMPDIGAILHEQAIQKYEYDNGYQSMKDYVEAISEGKPISGITFRSHLEEQGFGLEEIDRADLPIPGQAQEGDTHIGL